MMLFALFVPVLAAQQPWEAVAKGVLEGFGLGKDLDDMKDCFVGITVTEFMDLHDAVELFMKMDSHDVLKGLEKLGSAFEKLPVAVSHCDAAAKDVKDQAPKLLRAIHAMKSPTDFAYHVGKDLVVNHADIFQEVSAAIDAFEHQLWEDIGKNVGAALAKLVVGETLVMQLLVGEPPANSSNSSNRSGNPNRTQLVVILEGVLEGFGLTKDVELMRGCLNETETEVHLVHRAVDLLMKKDAKNVIDGLAKLGSAFDELPKLIGNCTIAAEDVKDEAPRLLQALETLKHPVDFAYHVGGSLIVNHADIFHEVSAAIDSYQRQQWEAFGSHTGEALSEILVGEKPAPAIIIV